MKMGAQVGLVLIIQLSILTFCWNSQKLLGRDKEEVRVMG
jgi:hypothetical protein